MMMGRSLTPPQPSSIMFGVMMPLPIVIWVGIGIVTLLCGTTIAVKWDQIVIALKGKQLAVLGARGVGKTHLITFLTSGSIPSEYKQTVTPGKASSRRFQLKDLDLKIKDLLDVAGSKDAYGEWNKLVLGQSAGPKGSPPKAEPADVIFYLLRADRIIAGDAVVEARVRDDLRHIGSWLEDLPSRPLFFIIGTHCDFDADFANLPADKLGDYVDRFRKLPIVAELVAWGGGSQRVQVVLGSMKTLEATEALVYQTFMQVAS